MGGFRIRGGQSRWEEGREERVSRWVIGRERKGGEEGRGGGT